MSVWNMETPVAFFVFNRPEKTKQVFEQISSVEPPTLLVVADGSRSGYDADPENCAAVRSYIEDNVDWECDLQLNYADKNLGLYERFTTGLEWIFNQVPEAIILEDDCLPNESFFRFCQVMLDEYRDDKRVMDISGSNYLETWKSDTQDYHFSFNGGTWGWATWRRAWELYDPEMDLWTDPEARARFRDVIADSHQADYLEYIFGKTFREHEAWSYPWAFARNMNSAHSVIPSKNLVSNIGFGEAATNTQNEDSPWANIPRHSLDFPLERKEYVAVDREYDDKFHKMRPVTHRYKILREARKLYERLT